MKKRSIARCITIISALLLLSSFCDADSTQLQLGQTDSGIIAGWSLIGPFDWSGSDKSNVLPELLETINKDTTAACGIGTEFQGHRWQYFTIDQHAQIDLKKAMGEASSVEAFAFCVIQPTKEGPATFSCGSDDGIQVWVDGKEVHKNIVWRGFNMDSDVFTVDLPARPVTCLVRATQGGGGWVFSLRVRDVQGNTLPVNPVCNIDTDTEAILRAFWDRSALTVNVSVSALTELGDVDVTVRTEAGQTFKETLLLPQMGDVQFASFPLPDVAVSSEYQKVFVSIHKGSKLLSETTVMLPPDLTISKRWVNAATKKDDLWVLTRKIPYDAQLADAFMGNGYFGIRVGAEGTEASAKKYATRISGIYMDGSRVDHPRWFDIDLFADGQAYRPTLDDKYSQKLDMKQCFVETNGVWNSPQGPIDVKIKMYPHRSRPHMLVTTYELKALESEANVTLQDKIDASHVGSHSNVQTRRDDTMVLSYDIEPIKLTEAVAAKWLLPKKGVQIDTTADANSIVRQLKINLKPGNTVKLVRYASLHTNRDSDDPVKTSVDEIATAIKTGEKKLFEEHVKAWDKLWQSDILVSNPRIQQLVHSALFQSYGNLRHDHLWSIGPVGLTGTAWWGGRVFWDADLWVYPPMALMQPSLSKAIVEYRANTLAGAIEDAKKEGRGGAKFAWESAQTGNEKCGWPPAIEQRHIQNDIALAQWQYYLATGDEDYLRDKALPVITASADYWVDRVTYNQQADRYEIHHVLGADEWSENVNNNLTTNYGAIFTLKLATQLNERFGKTVRPEWMQIADKMYLPFDEENQRYMQHDTYAGAQIKQADTSLAIYPYEMPMSEQIKRNILDFYPNNRPGTSIMMSSAIYSIAYAEIKDKADSEKYFDELIGYFWQPYLLTSEVTNTGQVPAADMTMSFVTGVGGFLQSFLNGFAGIRMHEDGLLVEPFLPDSIEWMEIKGLHYGGQKLNIRIDGDDVKITSEEALDFRVYDRSNTDYKVTKR